MIKVTYRKSSIGYMGYIKYIHDQKTIWSEGTSIIRLNKEDAIKDAEILKKQYDEITHW